MMEIKAFKLPPLPNRKPPALIQIQNRQVKKTSPQTGKRYPLSRDKNRNFQEQNQSSNKNINRRPSSVRSLSRESIESRGSRCSRGSSRERSIQLQKKESIQYNVKMRMSMPQISAKSWAVYELKQNKYIYGKRVCKRRQVASLTKIMNFITILQMVQQFSIDPEKLWVKVSKEASYLGGTTAAIKTDLQINLYDLYFGMMLPSGNDAAYQIAQIGGALMQMSKNEIKRELIYNINDFSEYYKRVNNPVRLYLCQMNKLSKKIGMMNSNFANPHGLSNPQNYSCAQDICRLCSYCMQRPAFRKIVRSQFYEKTYRRVATIQNEAQQINEDYFDQVKVTQTLLEHLRWENTNKMLIEGWSGIKTGITPNAGPCLAASICKQISGRDLQFLIVLVSSKSMDARWKEVRELVNWVVDQKLYF